ncbi:hypothetical protein ACJJTC_019319 [Scirpophaga incertulas]
MHWGMDTLELMLDLYKQQRILWDNKHPQYNHKGSKDEMFKFIASRLKMTNVTGVDVARKIRTMRAAYLVETRNIEAARSQGFYYNPTLPWFPIYKKVHEEIELLKNTDRSDEENISGNEEAPSAHTSTYAGARDRRRVQQGRVAHRTGPKSLNRPQIPMQPRRRLTPVQQHAAYPEDIFDLNNEDEFQVYADVVAEKLRKLPQHRALFLQGQIDKLLDKEIELDKGVLKYD